MSRARMFCAVLSLGLVAVADLNGVAYAQAPIFMRLRRGDDPETVAAILPIRRVDDPFRQEAWVHDAEVGEGFLGRLGTIQIQSIAFYFFDGQLFDITVRLPDILQSLEARRVLEERYGQPKLETVPL